MTKKLKNKKIKKTFRYNSGGYKSRYNLGGLQRRYQSGGMYDDNTVASAGQGMAANTSSIVYQESDPRLQQQRVSGLEEEKQRLMDVSASTAADVESRAEQSQIESDVKAMEASQRVEGTQAMAKQGLMATKTGLQEMGVLGKGTGLKAVADAYRLQRAANILGKAGKLTPEALSMAGKAGGTLGVVESGTKGAIEIAGFGSKAGAGASAGIVDPTGKAVAAGSKGSALAAGAGKFLTSGAGIGLLASGLGYGIQKLWGDDDPTKVNTAEAAGGILSGAGTGAGLGSFLGPIGTVAGGVIGGIVGGVGKFFGARKARRAQAKAEREHKAKVAKIVGKHNKKLMKSYGSQLAQVRAGEVAQKTYSGYDLGRNVVAQLGGLRMGMPRYGYAA